MDMISAACCSATKKEDKRLRPIVAAVGAGTGVLCPYTEEWRALKGEEILQELLAGLGEDGFGVELHAFEFVAAVAHTHDGAVVGFSGDSEFSREGFALDDERVVARGGEGVGELAENGFSIVMNLAGFAVKNFGGANHFAAESLAHGLVTEANT